MNIAFATDFQPLGTTHEEVSMRVRRADKLLGHFDADVPWGLETVDELSRILSGAGGYQPKATPCARPVRNNG